MSSVTHLRNLRKYKGRQETAVMTRVFQINADDLINSGSKYSLQIKIKNMVNNGNFPSN